jgi:hypothetical protein
MTESKTSTFTIHHDRCKPETWTAKDVLALAEFVRTGNLQTAARLSRLGVQLVLSEHHEPKGGSLEEIGWVVNADPSLIYTDLGEAVEADGDEDISALSRVYRSAPEYVVKYAIGDGDGNVEGHEFEIMRTQGEAEKFVADIMNNAVPATDGGER